ncbi:MAG: hypothetical protein JWO44_2789 [Bacteroidetes bacterium]|nr:hypothetical protein [Bacteroidota bacterium]
MITRGHFIGKIVDDLAGLKYQLETRNRLQLFDLTKFCEDFFKDLLNIVYNYNLINLNADRTNTPGIDLGDLKNKIAFQITSTNTKTKVNETLEKVTKTQIAQYKAIKIFIIGKKKVSYTIKPELINKTGFKAEHNIIDIDSLLKDVVVLEDEKLEQIFSLFKREFRQLKIELEPVDAEGNFESSYYNTMEKKPSSPPKNGLKFLGPKDNEYEKSFIKLIKLYNELALIPRVTREVIALIVDSGKYKPNSQFPNQFGIIPESLERKLRISRKELLTEINILEDAGLAEIEKAEIGNRSTNYLLINTTILNELLYWAKEEKLSIKTLLNTMNFSVLDE